MTLCDIAQRDSYLCIEIDNFPNVEATYPVVLKDPSDSPLFVYLALVFHVHCLFYNEYAE